MLIKNTILLSTVSLALAKLTPDNNSGLYKLPDLGDGRFIAFVDEDGQLNVTRLGDITTQPSANLVERLVERDDIPISGSGCYAIHSNHQDWDTAATEFKKDCDNGKKIPSGGILYAWAGLDVAFGCSWGGDNPCSSAEYQSFLDYLNQKCGPYRGGYVDMESWKKQYGMELQGENLCGKFTKTIRGDTGTDTGTN